MLAAHLGKSKRWVESRTGEGMPSRMHGNLRVYRVSVAEEWLIRHGHIQEEDVGA